MYLHNNRKETTKIMPHAKQEELLFTVYVGDHQWVDSVSMMWPCRWNVLCRAGRAGSSVCTGWGLWGGGRGALKICMLLFPVCIQKQEVEPNFAIDWFYRVVDMPACVRAHASTCKCPCGYIWKMCFRLQTCADLSRLAGQQREKFLMCGVVRLAYLSPRDVWR